VSSAGGWYAAGSRRMALASRCGRSLPRGSTGYPQPNIAVEPTANTVRCAPASGGGSPPALGCKQLYVGRQGADRTVILV
jgi:hypothetical protein